MGKVNMAAILLMLLFASTASAHPGRVFDVRNYGGKADGRSDVSKALSAAFKEACASAGPSRISIPIGEFALGHVTFQGPCKAPIEFEVRGTVKALTRVGNMNADGSWVAFQYMDQFKLSGGGVFDGQAPKAWGTCALGTDGEGLPVNIRFDSITNGMVRDITSKDSKQFHVSVLRCKNFNFTHFTVSAPGDSPNTNGIHIARSSKINIIDSNIATGDDCISVGDGTQQLSITKVTCGPGHGISVGSLGKYQNEAPVVGVDVRNCTISGATNGVRIKTWPASYAGFVSDMHFEDIIMNNVTNPVLIDQLYCPWNQCNSKLPSLVKISNVSFRNIRGTSASPVAVKLACSSGIPCQGVEVADIDLTYTGNETPTAVFECSNVRPRLSGKQNPPACTSPSTPN